MSRAILDINKEEQTARGSSDQEQGFTAPAWVAEGLEIEVQQQRLKEDIKEYGTGITDRQSLDVFNRRSSLSSRIIRHRSNAALFVDVAPLSSGVVESLAEETDGQPEIASLFLPSQAKKLVIRSERTLRVSSIEYWLRQVACFRTIHRIKVALIQKTNMIKTKDKHATGQIRNTRAQAAVNRISERAEAAVWEFNTSYKAMKTLGFKNNDASLLKSIKPKDLSGVVTTLGGAKKLGEGYKKLPWFWLLKSDSKQQTDADVQEELNEANRVEWFRGRARYERWREEECWLRREMASVILDFNARATHWEGLSQTDNAAVNAGYRVYCLRQRDTWLTMRNDAYQRGRSLLLCIDSTQNQ
ncbi:hypothetical protein FRC09_015470 [Ceratobasidium sp. 395]|nr:hypothetical protein FRC09_015470 [Ceratobasidium sp. 395]